MQLKLSRTRKMGYILVLLCMHMGCGKVASTLRIDTEDKNITHCIPDICNALIGGTFQSFKAVVEKNPRCMEQLDPDGNTALHLVFLQNWDCDKNWDFDKNKYSVQSMTTKGVEEPEHPQKSREEYTAKAQYMLEHPGTRKYVSCRNRYDKTPIAYALAMHDEEARNLILGKPELDEFVLDYIDKEEDGIALKQLLSRKNVCIHKVVFQLLYRGGQKIYKWAQTVDKNIDLSKALHYAISSRAEAICKQAMSALISLSNEDKSAIMGSISYTIFNAEPDSEVTFNWSILQLAKALLNQQYNGRYIQHKPDQTYTNTKYFSQAYINEIGRTMHRNLMEQIEKGNRKPRARKGNKKEKPNDELGERMSNDVFTYTGCAAGYARHIGDQALYDSIKRRVCDSEIPGYHLGISQCQEALSNILLDDAWDRLAEGMKQKAPENIAVDTCVQDISKTKTLRRSFTHWFSSKKTS